jgi:hypothetical protein
LACQPSRIENAIDPARAGYYGPFGEQDTIFHSCGEWKIAVFKALLEFVLEFFESDQFLPLGIRDPPEPFRWVA